MAETAPYILIVDDQESDRRLLELAFQRASGLRIAALLDNGEETIAYLDGIGKFVDRAKYPLPSLLILNFKMPRMSGLDVLAWMRERSFPDLKVVILSGSLDAASRELALNMGAHLYWEKPMEFSGWLQIAKSVEKYLQGGN
ncbi:MAG: putative response regulator, CheY [Pedosphaera sp.]|nr:putative response regulator, CheY [Pedosphaera sp.]